MESAAKVRLGSIVWRYSGASPAPAVLDEVSPIAEALPERKQGEVVRSLANRLVLRLRLGAPSQMYYLKYYRSHGLRGLLEGRVWPQRAKLEFARAHRLVRLRIGTFDAVAYGEKDAEGLGRTSYLLTREVEEAAALNRFIRATAPGLSQGDRRAFVATFTPLLARFARSLHDAGVFHNDFHPGNILVRQKDGAFEFFLIDLRTVRISRPLSKRHRIESLAMLNEFFVSWTSAAERLRFLRLYAGDSSQLPEELRRQSRTIEEATQTRIRKTQTKRERRCRRAGRYFARMRHGCLKGLRLRQLRGVSLDGFPADPSVFFRNEARFIKKGRTTTLVEVQSHESGLPCNVIVKRYNRKKPFNTFKDLFRSSRAMRTWRLTNALLVRGIPCPTPLAVVEERRMRVLLRSYLVSEKIEAAVTLRDFLAGAAERPDSQDRALLTRSLAATLRRMHDAGFSHRDLKTTNIMIQAANGVHPYILDLDGMRRLGTVGETRRQKDLARLNASAEEQGVGNRRRYEFLRSYLGPRVPRAEARRWWKAIEKLSEKHRKGPRTA